MCYEKKKSKIWDFRLFYLFLQANNALEMDIEDRKRLKQYLIRRLKKANAFWSYNQESIKKVPDDISIIGFDNIRTGEFVTPKLSTFNIPRQEIGEEVAKYIANSIKSHQIAYSQIVIRCDYIERESNREIVK